MKSAYQWLIIFSLETCWGISQKSFLEIRFCTQYDIYSPWNPSSHAMLKQKREFVKFYNGVTCRFVGTFHCVLTTFEFSLWYVARSSAISWMGCDARCGHVTTEPLSASTPLHPNCSWQGIVCCFFSMYSSLVTKTIAHYSRINSLFLKYVYFFDTCKLFKN